MNEYRHRPLDIDGNQEYKAVEGRGILEKEGPYI